MKFYINMKKGTKYIYLIVNAADKYEAMDKANASYPDYTATSGAKEITAEI